MNIKWRGKGEMLNAYNGKKFKLTTITEEDEKFIENFVLYEGIGRIELSLCLPGTYLKYMQDLLGVRCSNDSRKITSYVTKLIIADLEKRLAADLSLANKYKICGLTPDEKGFFLEELVSDAVCSHVLEHIGSKFELRPVE